MELLFKYFKNWMQISISRKIWGKYIPGLKKNICRSAFSQPKKEYYNKKRYNIHII